MKIIQGILLFVCIPFAILIFVLALVACLLLLPARLFDLWTESDTDWSNSPYSFIGNIFNVKEGA